MSHERLPGGETRQVQDEEEALGQLLLRMIRHWIWWP